MMGITGNSVVCPVNTGREREAGNAVMACKAIKKRQARRDWRLALRKKA